MSTIKDHNSDVYAITFNPRRPFTFASCSRDTTIRLFSIDTMIDSLKMQLLQNTKHKVSNNSIYDDPMSCFTSKENKYKLCSEKAASMLQMSEKDAFNSPIEQFKTFYEYLNFTDGQQELFQIIDYIAHKTKLKGGEQAQLADNRVVHNSQLSESM
jgi:WD40 repeat protein